MNAARRKQQGSTIFEGTVALIVLCFLFFGMFQIYQWCVNKIFCEYAAFYGAKGMALGYRTAISNRAVRVAAIGISGRNESVGAQKISTSQEYDMAQSYMQRGDYSGVWYEYWLQKSNDAPILRFGGYYQDWGNNDTAVSSTVKLENSPLLRKELAAPLGIGKTPDCASSVTTYNYSNLYLED